MVAFVDNSEHPLNQRFHFGSADFILLIYETNIFSLCITDWRRTIMKKKVITLLLAVVLASGSVGNVPVMAAEAT